MYDRNGLLYPCLCLDIGQIRITHAFNKRRNIFQNKHMGYIQYCANVLGHPVFWL